MTSEPRVNEEARIVAAFLARRQEADFRALYRRHTPALYRCALRCWSGRGEEAEEIVQETWTRALHQLAGFRGDSSLRTWLTGIALRCLRELERERTRTWTPTQDRPEDLEAPPDEASQSGPFDHISTRALEAAIARLPGGYRRVLVLHDVEGFTHDEIAGLLEIAPGTSKSQLSRARRHLRSQLTEPRTTNHEAHES